MSMANSDAPEMGLSSDLVYNRQKLNSVGCRKQTFSYSPWNSSTGGFTGNDTAKINISGGSAQFLQNRASFLQLRVNAVGVSGELDGSAYSLIKTIAVYQGSTLLERLDGYGNRYQTVYSLQGNLSNAGSGDSILYGTGTEVLSNGVAVGAGASISIGPTMAAKGCLVPTGGATFCLPLVGSAIFGPGNTKMLPLCKISELRLEITFDTLAAAFFSSNAITGFTVSDVKYVAEIVTLESDVMTMIDHQIAQSGGELKISSEGWVNFQAAHTTANLVGNQLIPARFASVKTAITTFRQTANQAVTKRYMTSRSKPDMRSWSYVCGNVRYPLNEVTDDVAGYAETQKALHHLGTLDSSGLCNRVNWSEAGAGLLTGTYCLATCLESQYGKSGGLAGCGLDLRRQDMYLSYSLNSSTVGYQVDTYINYDVLLTIKPDRLIYISN